jgi:thiol-disulfide isomerase/thioredoxin
MHIKEFLMKKLLCAGLLALFTVGLWGCKFEIPGADKVAPLASTGTAPEFDLQKVSGGSLRSADLRGKVVIVDFWATWCGPCLSEIPNYNKLMADNAGKGLEIIGVTLESGKVGAVAEFAKEKGIDYTLVMGNEAVQEGFQFGSQFPTTYVIGKDWNVYRKYVGALKDKKAKIEQDVAALMAK